MGLAFRSKILIGIVELLKVFLHPPPPLERECFGPIVESRIPKMTILSISKMGSKNGIVNYLFEDYRLKSGIKSPILALAISGRNL